MDDDENLALPDFLVGMDNADNLSLSGSLPDDMDDEDNLPLAIAFPEIIDEGNAASPSVREPDNNARDLPQRGDLPDSEAQAGSSSMSRPSVSYSESLSLSVAIPDSTVDEDDLPLSVVFHDGIVRDDDDLALRDDRDDLVSSEVQPDGIDDADSLIAAAALSRARNNADNLSLSEAVPQAVNSAEILMKSIKRCSLPKLSKNYDENESLVEYETRNNDLYTNIRGVVKGLEEMDIKNTSDNAEMTREEKITVLSSLLILCKELRCEGPWNSDNTKEGARKLNEIFQRKCGFKMDNLLKRNGICGNQNVFDKMLDELSLKLNSDDFKKYPGLIEVYCEVVQSFQNFDVKVNPVKILPVALILIDDYIESNKMKGLQCCRSILRNLTVKHFEKGNYYDVIYICLQRARSNKGLRITELSNACSLELCRFFPSNVKDAKLDDMYSDALEQLYTECNLYRKAALFKYTKCLMTILQIKCVGKSLFKTVVADSIESCLTDAVANIVLLPTLQCLEEWIKYCWPVWKLSVDFKVLCALLKYYSQCNGGEGSMLTQQLISTLVSLCSPEEQKLFMAKLAESEVAENPKMEKLKNVKDVGTQS